MNKVFKVIWSDARSAYVVVSEMAKSHGTKSCSTKKLLTMLIATGVMTCASVAPAMATNLAPTDTQIEAGTGANASGEGSVAIGQNAAASGLVGIAIGRDAEASGTDSIAIGSDTKATKIYSVAIGNDIQYTGESATAVGQQAHATGKVSTAIGIMTNVDADWNAAHQGQWRQAGDHSTAVGAYSGSWGLASTALGGFSRADEKFATAVGYDSHATAERATTLGAKAEANAYESVAIGSFSVANREGGIVGAFAPEGADSLTWKANAGAVSVGSDTITRQITHVAAGSEATDAVNVGQLKEVGEVAANANKGWNLSTNGVATEATNVAPGEIVDFNGDKNISVSHDGTKVQVKLNENIDVNSVQTNALNSKYNLSVGTMAENGIMPFFVNSTGAFYAAHNKFSVDKDGKVTATAGEIGNVVLQNGVYTGHSALRDGELFVGDASGNYSQITTKGAKLGKVTVAEDGKITGVAAGKISADSTDAVNGSQLNDVKTEAGKHTKVVNGSNINVEEINDNGQKTYKVGLNNDILLGDITGKNVSISGTNGTIEATGNIMTNNRVIADKGAKLADVDVTGDTISNGNSSVKLDKEGTVTVNNKVTIDGTGKVSGVAKGEISDTSTDAVNGSQLNDTNTRVTNVENDVTNIKGDITTIKGDITNIKGDITTIKGDVTNLDNRVTEVEKTAGKHSSVSTEDSNLSISEGMNTAGGTDYKLSLNKDLQLDSVTTGDTKMDTNGVQVGNNVSLTKDGLTAGDTKVTNDGLSIGGKNYVSKDGLNANNQTITNVADGKVEKGSTDAVNGGQLYETNQAIANNATNISSLSNSLSNLDNRVNKVGAGAAALAALHPLDFDPDAKWDFAAGYGNYRGTNAAAVGAYYRPNEDTMFSVGGTFGNGENMVNAGVSFKLGSGSSHVSTSRVAMAKEIKELRGELEAMKSAMLDANAGKKIDTSKLQLFPDVPQNHWAYEYVTQLAGNGMIEGYPDGNFAGDRPMTRYEFAAILYRAMTKGAVLSDKILNEFSHELEYFTVDTVAKDKAGNPTIQRVRTVKANTNK